MELPEAIGRVLAEEIRADRDFPPFDRVAMDGIAIHFEQWAEGRKDFVIEQTQAAGEPQKKLSDISKCLEVMTGAMLPKGTDTVIRYEDINVQDGTATVLLSELLPGSNIHKRRQDVAQSEVLLEPGMLLSPAEIALLASVGKTHVTVFPYPATAIISSGDELVGVDVSPEPHQIRQSNVYALEAAMREMHWPAKRYHLPDRKDVLETRIKELVDQNDVIVLSGGVSKGKFDFIPEVMESIGVKKVFHQVSQRPGKPFWFGVSDNGKIVFALPGNPVSTYMCFYRYIKPWIMKSLTGKNFVQHAVLAKDFNFAPNVTYFLQVEARNEAGMVKAYPLAGGGSGDFANLKKVTGFIELPEDKTHFWAGEIFPYYNFR